MTLDETTLRRLYAIKWRKLTEEERLLRVVARSITQKALRAGVIKRGDKCEDCGKVGKLELHHNDYSEPLDVAWLCNWCHYRRTHDPRWDLRDNITR